MAIVVETIASAMRETFDRSAQPSRLVLGVAFVPVLPWIDDKATEIAGWMLRLSTPMVVEFFALGGGEAVVAHQYDSSVKILRIRGGSRLSAS